jgi:hypothetical protein
MLKILFLIKKLLKSFEIPATKRVNQIKSNPNRLLIVKIIKL